MVEYQSSEKNSSGFGPENEISKVSEGNYTFGACGGTLKTLDGLLTSPSYPDNYQNNEDCVYTISPDKGTIISLTFISMDIEHEDTCSYDYLEIRDGLSDYSPFLNKLCGNEIPAPIQSSQNQIWLK